MDRSGKTKCIKDYWHSLDILKSVNNFNVAWEEVSLNFLNGMWFIFLPEFMHGFTRLDQVKNIDEDIIRLAQVAKLDKITVEDIIGLLDSKHGLLPRKT